MDEAKQIIPRTIAEQPKGWHRSRQLQTIAAEVTSNIYGVDYSTHDQWWPLYEFLEQQLANLIRGR
jgi:hypothetical protein